MPDTFVIGDTHFGHRKIIQFEPVLRPFATISIGQLNLGE